MFGMGTGVTPLPWPPSKNEYITRHKVCKGGWAFFLKKSDFFFERHSPLQASPRIPHTGLIQDFNQLPVLHPQNLRLHLGHVFLLGMEEAVLAGDGHVQNLVAGVVMLDAALGQDVDTGGGGGGKNQGGQVPYQGDGGRQMGRNQAGQQMAHIVHTLQHHGLEGVQILHLLVLVIHFPKLFHQCRHLRRNSRTVQSPQHVAQVHQIALQPGDELFQGDSPLEAGGGKELGVEGQLLFLLALEPQGWPRVLAHHIPQLSLEQGVQVPHNAAVGSQQRADLAEDSQLVLAAHIDDARANGSVPAVGELQQVGEQLLVGVALHKNLVVGKEELLVIGVEAGQEAAEQELILGRKLVYVGGDTVHMADDDTHQVFREAQVDEEGGMGYQEENLSRLLSGGLANLLHKEELELGVQVQLRLVKDEAVPLAVVEGNQKLEDFLEAVALALLQVVFHTTGPVHHHGHKAAVLPLPKGDGLAEHAGKHGLYPLLYLLVVPQHCQHLVLRDAVGTQEGNIQVVVAELGGNLVGQKCLPGAVGPHDEVHLRPVALLEGRLSPQEGQPHPCFDVDHETIVPHFWPKTKGRGEKDGQDAGG